MMDQYKKELAVIDAQLGRILSITQGEDTLIVFTGAYGESFGEDDVWYHRGTVANEESLRVPFILSHPNQLPEKQVVRGRIELIDVVPTLLDLLKMEPPTFRDGESMSGTVYGSAGRTEIRAVAVPDDPILYRSSSLGSWLPADENRYLQDKQIKKPTARWKDLLEQVGY